MDYKTALRLREMHPDTCGIIAIGISEGQIVKLLDAPGVDYVIPYHVSGLNKELVKKYDPGLADHALKYIMDSDLGEKLSRGGNGDRGRRS